MFREIAAWHEKNSEKFILRASKNSFHHEISTKNDDIRNNTDNNNNNNIQSIYNLKWVDHLNKIFDETNIYTK